MSTLRFALRALRRDARAGELRVLLFALIIAVGGLTAVNFFAQRMQAAMEQQAAELLAADLVVSGSTPPTAALIDAARRAHLSYANTASFYSAVSTAQGFQLAEVKAVSDGYPLRGHLRSAAAPFARDTLADEIPQPGTVWAEAKILPALNLRVGDVLSLGQAQLRIARVITYEPDRSGDFFSIAPRVLMNMRDVAATQLIQPGSRVEYRLLLAGPATAIEQFRRDIGPTLGNGTRMLTVRDARPELRVALQRAEQFLSLAALVAAVLAGVAIASAALRYATRHLDSVALMRCFGATQAFVLRMFGWQLALLALVGGIVGSVVGYVAQFALSALLGGLLHQQLPTVAATPMLYGLITAAVMLLGFALPLLARLRHVPPLRVLRRDLGAIPPSTVMLYLGASGAIVLLLLMQVHDLRLAAWVLLGLAATLASLALGAYALVKLLAPLRTRVGVAWRYGFANLARRPVSTVLQVAAFGAGIMVLLLLSIVRSDLLENWRKGLPADAPNRFLINIQPDQVADVSAFLTQQHRAATLYPMVRGRFIAHNGKSVSPNDYRDLQTRQLAEREFNLSWAAQPSPDNAIVAGRWWQTPNEHGWSVETGLAQRLGLQLGDRLRFRIGADEIEAPITSLRRVEWDSFRVNFFVVAPPAMLQHQPASYITAFHLPAAEKNTLAALVQRFPNVTVIDVDALMQKVRDIMDRVTWAVEYVFVFSLLAGLAVLYAALQNTEDERRFESAVLRTLGASRAQLVRGLLAEFIALGLLSGMLAAIAASAVSYVLSTRVFHLPYHFNVWLWAVGLSGGAIGIAMAGMWRTLPVIRQSPLRVLREG